MRALTNVNESIKLSNYGDFLVFFFNKRNKIPLLLNGIYPQDCGYRHVTAKCKKTTQ